MLFRIDHAAIRILVIVTFCGATAQAQIPGVSASGVANSGGAEYFAGRIEGKPLITVDLLDGVKLPGVYHIPVQTNMAQLFAYAGGLNDTADVEKITVRNQKSAGVTSANYDLEKIMAKNDPLPTLQDNDVVHVSMSRDSLPRTALWVGIISSVAAIILTTVIIERGK